MNAPDIARVDRSGVDSEGGGAPLPVFYAHDHVVVTSVGVDIGSSTSHLSFSRLVLRRETTSLSSRFVVVQRRPIWASDVVLTPYREVGGLIDADALGRFVAESYVRAGLGRRDVDTGVVILTGQALKRENSRAIADAISAQAGEFVCVAAGDHFEAVLSAFGSGAVEHSAATGRSVLCIDIGGGTTKLSLARDGRVVSTAVLSVGARLVSWDPGSRAVRSVAEELHAFQPPSVALDVGTTVAAAAERELAAAAVDQIVAAATGRAEDLAAGVVVPGSDVAAMRAAELVTVSGGVAEYVHGREPAGFGDLGAAIGSDLEVRLAAGALQAEWVDTGAGIRSTVAGASQYSVQVSGSTVAVSRTATLPLRNVPVLRPRIGSEGGDIDVDGDIDAVAAAVADELERTTDATALAISLRVGPDLAYRRLRALAEGLARGLDRGAVPVGVPVVVLLDRDVAQSVGHILFDELAVERPMVCLDNLALEELAFVDVGQVVTPPGVYPVIVKSLLFASAPAATPRMALPAPVRT